MVPAVLVAALLAAGSGLIVELRAVGEPRARSGGVPASASRSPSSPAVSPSEVRSPTPDPSHSEPSEPVLAARPAELCAFDPSRTPEPLDDTQSSARAQIAAIAERVEELRELGFDKPVSPVFQSGDRMAKRLTKQITNSYTRAAARRDEQILSALGAIPFRTDLRKVVSEGLAGDVLGYYVPKTGRLLVQKLDADDELGAGEKFVLSHELEHALADQALGLPDDENVAPSQADAAAARQALIEGDATIAMLQFATTSLTDAERLSLATDSSLGGESSLENAPYFVRKTFEFPYDRGADFVCALYARGRWDAVDRAYRNPPSTSAQVLFPQHYLDRVEPENPRNPKRPGPAWVRHPVQSVGAADLLWLLEAPGGERVRSLDDPERRVMGWRGGEAHLFTNGRAHAVAMDLVASGRSGLLCDSIEAWYRVSHPVERVFKKRGAERFALASRRQSAVLRCSSGEVRLGIAPTLPVARSLAR